MKLSQVLQQTKDIDNILSFEELGRMIRAIKPFCDPLSKYITKSAAMIHCTNYRMYDILTIAIHDSWNEDRAVLVDESPRLYSVLQILDTLSVKYNIDSRYIMINVFPDIRLTCFNTSDDPEVWKVKQARAEELSKVRRVVKRLDRR